MQRINDLLEDARRVIGSNNLPAYPNPEKDYDIRIGVPGTVFKLLEKKFCGTIEVRAFKTPKVNLHGRFIGYWNPENRSPSIENPEADTKPGNVEWLRF